MAKPIAVAKGIAFAFPDVCKVPVGSGMVPVPFPNIAKLGDASPVSDQSGKELKAGGDYVLLKTSEVASSSGDEAGSGGGVKSGGTAGTCKIKQASQTVVYGPEKAGLVRFMDPTEQNDSNAAGFVLSTLPTVFVGD